MLGFLRFTINQAANGHLNERNCGYGYYDCRSIRLLAFCYKLYKLMFLVGEKGPFCPILSNSLMAKGKLKIDLSYECTYKYGHNIVNL